MEYNTEEKVRIGCFFAFAATLLVSIVFIGFAIRRHVVENAKEVQEKERRTAALQKLKASRRPSSFILADHATEGIIVTLKGYGALNAGITVKGDTINLAVEVPHRMGKEQAKRICDNFVRQVMALSNDNDPQMMIIGKGHFSYHVGAFTPDQKWIIRGYKADYSSEIAW